MHRISIENNIIKYFINISIVITLAALACAGNTGMNNIPVSDGNQDNTTLNNDFYESIKWHNGLVYLEKIVEWHPGVAGYSRNGTYESGMIDKDHNPVLNDFAFGAPEGAGSMNSNSENDGLMLGINGSAAFKFKYGYYIYNGDGDDFRTWGDRFCWGGYVNKHCCELAHVEVSEDCITWYYNTNEVYDINPDPSAGNSNYSYFNTKGLHGNTPNWANYKKEMQAQIMKETDGQWKWADLPGVFVPVCFKPDDPYAGGDTFNLDDFRSVTDNTPWPSDGRMRYIKFTDDDSILDGQAYSPSWCTGAIIQAAVGINVGKENE